jgi:DNA-binding CsgD family transcriptional regulator
MSDLNGLGETLTSREIEVLKLIATGLSTKEIAASLDIAFKTAACHRSRVMAKLNIHDVANLTRYAIRNGYVDAWDSNGGNRESQQRLFDQVRLMQAKYRRALDEYSAFLRERESIGPENPDSHTGTRGLRLAEEAAHENYHAALVALKHFLLGR